MLGAWLFDSVFAIYHGADGHSQRFCIADQDLPKRYSISKSDRVLLIAVVRASSTAGESALDLPSQY